MVYEMVHVERHGFLIRLPVRRELSCVQRRPNDKVDSHAENFIRSRSALKFGRSRFG